MTECACLLQAELELEHHGACYLTWWEVMGKLPGTPTRPLTIEPEGSKVRDGSIGVPIDHQDTTWLHYCTWGR